MTTNIGDKEIIMAKRICFISRPNDKPIYEEVEVDFKYYNGFAISQKQKSIKSLHKSINSLDNSLNALEVSTKATEPIGIALSAFNLKFLDEVSKVEYPIENIFQSSKVFDGGGPFRDLLNVHPKDAKRNERLKTSGDLKCFNVNNVIWELEPKTMFYDWIYISALSRNESLSKEILKYNAFTDIEFNHQKSINCQARSAAIYVSLCNKGKVSEVLNNKNKFKAIYNINSQTTLFDI